MKPSTWILALILSGVMVLGPLPAEEEQAEPAPPPEPPAAEQEQSAAEEETPTEEAPPEKPPGPPAEPEGEQARPPEERPGPPGPPGERRRGRFRPPFGPWGGPGRPMFGPPGPGQPGAGPPPAGLPRRTDERISMSFEKADIHAVLRALSEAWGVTIVADPQLEGTVTVLSMVDITIEESFEVLKAILEVKGFGVLGTLQDRIIKIVPLTEVAQRPTVLRTEEGVEGLRDTATIITQIIPLKFLDATQLQKELQPLVSSERASLVAVSSTNHLILTDMESNVKRILSIIELLDQVPPDDRRIEIIPLKNADAQQLAQLLSQLFRSPLETFLRRMREQRRGRPPSPQEQQRMAAAAQAAGGFSRREQVTVTADPRTNSLIVYASPENLEEVKQLVERLDVDLSVNQVEIFQLEYASAEEVANILSQLLLAEVGPSSRRPEFGPRLPSRPRAGETDQPVIIVPDARTNQLLVYAPPKDLERIRFYLSKLDVNVLAENKLEVIQLQHASATELEGIIEELFQRGTSAGFDPRRAFFQMRFGRAPSMGRRPGEPEMALLVVADERTNSLIVSAPAEDMEAIKALIAKLDVDLRINVLRTVQLEHADAEEVANILNQLYQEGAEGARQITPFFRPSPFGFPFRRPSTTSRRLPTEEPIMFVADTRTNSVVISAPPEEMEEILQLIKELDTDFTPTVTEIIRLENADAEETANLLTELFAEEETTRLSTRFTGFRFPFGFGGRTPTRRRTTGASTAGKVKFAYDTRTNSLIVTAPPDQMETIKEMVAQLDVDLRPPVIHRRFKLQYADATTVAEELNELFEQPQGGLRGTTRGLPFFFRSTQPTYGKYGFTGLRENIVVADVRTNSVIVTATEENMAVYEQVIKDLDEEAKLTAMTRVYQLKYAVAQDLAQTLNQLLRGQQRFGGFFFFMFGQRQRTGSPLDILQDVNIVADSKTNSLVVTAPPQAFDALEQLIEQLDQPQGQVYINVIIADVTLSDETKLGFEWSWLNSTSTGDTMGTDFDLDAETMGFRYTILNDNFQSLLHALATRSDVRVISTPHITTLDNTQAQITIGQQYPYPASIRFDAFGNPIVSIDFAEIMISLTVTPHINLGSNTLTLDVEQTINELAGIVTQYGGEQPIIANRQARTSIRVESGQTIVIGGIMRDRAEHEVKGVPLLSEIPILGELFKSRRRKTEKTELLVFLTPFIVTSPEELDRLRREREERLREIVPQFRSPGSPEEGTTGEGEAPATPPTEAATETSAGAASPSGPPEVTVPSSVPGLKVRLRVGG